MGNIKCGNAWRNRHRCRAPRSPPCARRSRRGAEGWEWAHRVSRGCGGNARKRSAGADPPDRRPAFRRNGSRRRRGRTSLVPYRPRHGAPNGARRKVERARNNRAALHRAQPRSQSASERAQPASSNARNTSNRAAVGRMPRCNSFSSSWVDMGKWGEELRKMPHRGEHVV